MNVENPQFSKELTALGNVLAGEKVADLGQRNTFIVVGEEKGGDRVILLRLTSDDPKTTRPFVLWEKTRLVRRESPHFPN